MPSLSRALLLPLLLACGGSDAERGAPASELPAFRGQPIAEHAEEVVGYELVARLDPVSHEIRGEGTITLTNTSQAELHELWFHRYLNAFKNERSLFLRERSSGFRGDRRELSWGFCELHSLRWQTDDGELDLLPHALPDPEPGDETELGVALPRPVKVGERIRLKVQWTSRLPSVVLRTGHAERFHLAGQWFPKLAKLESDGRFVHFPFHRFSEFYANFGSYRVQIEVPETFTVGATGALEASESSGGHRRETYRARDVHDFAFTAWDQFVELKEQVGAVAVRVLTPPGHEAVARRQLEVLRFAIPHYGARYGAYPYPTLTVVHPPANAPEAGGMEYPTFITTGGDPRTPSFVRNIEAVTMHEFGHQYFYGLLASDEHHAPLLDEGLNSFSEIDALERLFGPETAGGGIGVLRLGIADVHALAGRRYTHDTTIARAAPDFPNGSSYGAQIYSRTATVLETLKRTVGEEAFFLMFGAYTRRHRFSHPTLDDLLACVREHLGEEAREFLHQALTASGTLDVKILEAKSQQRAEPGGLFAAEREPRPRELGDDFVSTILLSHHGALRLPVDVELRFSDGSAQRRTWHMPAQPTEWLRVESKARLTAVLVDPEQKLLLDDNWENNQYFLEPNPAPTGRSALLGISLPLWLAELL